MPAIPLAVSRQETDQRYLSTLADPENLCKLLEDTPYGVECKALCRDFCRNFADCGRADSPTTRVLGYCSDFLLVMPPNTSSEELNPADHIKEVEGRILLRLKVDHPPQ
ncbi:hypothetical protein K8Q93_03620 [Candidatus Parcubacteria bacterium]|nr:hypothetical protein [Candidatus Parcubacteria bacterium]